MIVRQLKLKLNAWRGNKITKAPFAWRNFLLSSILCLGLFILPAIVSNAYAWYCSSVEETNLVGGVASWVAGFEEIYSAWLTAAEEIKRLHKIQAGVFTEADNLKSLITGTSANAVVSSIKSQADNVVSSFTDNTAKTPGSRASDKIDALRAGAAVTAYQTAKNSYELTLSIDQQLKSFSPSKMDVAATSQIQKDLVQLQKLAAMITAETMKLEAYENSLRAAIDSEAPAGQDKED